MKGKNWITPQELAHQLGVHPETVRRWIRTGRLRAEPLTVTERARERQRCGPHGRYRIELEEVQRLVTS